LSGRNLPEKNPPARLDQVNKGILFSRYQARAAPWDGPLMVTQPVQGGWAWSARLKCGLLAAKGVKPCSTA